MSRQVFTCPHCLGNADKLTEDENSVRVKCRDCEVECNLNKVDL